MKYIPRLIEREIKRYLKIFPAVAITGPRQSGKSTTLQKIFGNKYQYISFDDPILIDFFLNDPKGFLNQYSDKIIFDEIQKVPSLFDYLKIEIDQDRKKYGKFILTGSSQFTLVKQITESLAGRIGALSLLPFQRDEVPEKLKPLQILKGSYPELISRNYNHSKEWFGAYVNYYIERDVRSLHNVGNLRDFQRLIMLLAARTSQELNMSALAAEIGVNVKTVQNWISILEASYIIFLIPPFHKNFGKRIVKRPKVYFYDTGLVCFLTGINSLDILKKGPLDGPVFENYIISEIKKHVIHTASNSHMYYFRSNLGVEVDLILENHDKSTISFVEIKSGQTAKYEMIKNMRTLMDKEKTNSSFKTKGYLIYRGKESAGFSKDIQCLNHTDLNLLFK